MSAPLSQQFRNGEISFWARDITSCATRPALTSSIDADIAIVGGGFTGLWTAYYLKMAKPSARIVVLEQRIVGYGASGRNGGWLSAEFAGSRLRYAAETSRDAVLRFQRALVSSIHEVIDVCVREGIEADIKHTGLLSVALTESQRRRLQAKVAEDRAWGLTEADVRLLEPREAQERIRVAGAQAMAFSPHGARIQPAKLVAGLARAVERSGVEIYEDTPVLEIAPHEARTAAGVVTARYVVRATEGFTPHLPQSRRDWLPMNSVMIVTEPLSSQTWSEIGWDWAELLGTLSHSFLYAQCTSDGRIAIGGRGNPYRFGSRTDNGARARLSDVRGLWDSLKSMFPSLRGSAVAHAWCGTLAVSRDWCASVDVDRANGIAFAGGYAGHGVTMSNLAARSLRDLLLDTETELTAMPYVGRGVRRWEPEPLRWLGVQTLYGLYRQADRSEERGGAQTSVLARIADAISGR